MRKDKYNARKRDLYRQRKADGICTVCGKHSAELGKVLCATCGTAKREAGVRKYRDRVAEWRCTSCGCKVDNGETRCGTCSDIRNDARRTTKNTVHIKNVKKTKKITIFHALRRAKAAAIQRERYHFLRENGLCVRCKERAALPGESLCMDCKLYHNQMRSGAHVSSYGRYAR